MYGYTVSHKPDTVTASTFLSPRLAAHISSGTSVSSALATDPTEAVHAVAESLYGKKHGSAHHDLASDQAREGAESETSGLKRVMEKLHLMKTKTEDDYNDGAEGKHDKDRANPAADQWVAMRPLSESELKEVEGYGQWGGAQPSELFLNCYAQALLTLEEYPLNGMVSPSLMGSHGVIPLSIVSVIPDIIQHHADLIVRAEHEVFLATNYWEASGAAQTIVDAIKELSRRVQARTGPPVVFKLMYDRGNPSQIVHPHQLVDPHTYTADKVKLPLPDDIPGVELQVQNYHEPPVGTFHAKYMVVDRKIAILNSNNIQDRVNVEMMTHIGPIVQSIYDLALLSWSLPLSPPLPLLTQPPVYPPNLSRDNFVFGTSHPLLEPKGDLQRAGEESRRVLKEHHEGVELRGQDSSRDDAGMGDEASHHATRRSGQGDTPLGSGSARQDKGRMWDESNTAEAKRVDSQFGTEAAITEHLNAGTKISGTDTDVSPDADVFTPIILHSPHDPVPMALVCRAPRGKPGHGDTYVPQDQAWLAAFKFAKKNVFIQTPTFNAKPVVEAALEAVRRGVLVEIYADLGFNDEGELLPYQGGTNEMVASYMYDHLTEQEKSLLKIYWYTGKDQKTPLNAKDKSRNCHVKLMIADEHLIIQGNGNQDTQSWFHSQEVNIMVDSPLLAAEIRRGVDANQNTRHHGLVDSSDGVWRDEKGKELPGQKKPPKGPFKSLVGVKGAVQRVRGEGGF